MILPPSVLEERNPRTELRPSLRLTEPGGEESKPRELLILQGIETGSG